MRAAFLASFAASLLLPSAGAFAQADGLADFRAGQTSRFSSQGHSKAKGLNFTIRYPRSWRAQEADRPNTVQSFVSSDGSGSNCNIVIRDSGMSAAQARASVRPEAFRAQLPTGMIFVSGQSTTLDAHPGAEVQVRQSVNRAGSTLEARIVMFATTDKTNIFLLTCMAGGRTAADADGRSAAYLPLFRLIAGSIVFPDQYR
ncbi:MAG: hypothetical protein ACXW2T_01305 [Allosphingosinicella sp.]